MAKRKTAGERIAADFVGPHPTLARRIDAAIRRAVKAAYRNGYTDHEFGVPSLHPRTVTTPKAAHQTGKVQARTNIKGGTNGK